MCRQFNGLIYYYYYYNFNVRNNGLRVQILKSKHYTAVDIIEVLNQKLKYNMKREGEKKTITMIVL